MKKTISIILAVIMLVSCIPFAASAQGDVYTPLYDKDTPVVLLHGIGQNDTYVYNEDGTIMKDKDGGDATGWPLETDLEGLLKPVIPKLILSVFTRKDSGLKEAMKEGGRNLLWAIEKDNEGNYKYDVRPMHYTCPMSEMPDDVKSMYYNCMPMQKCKDIIGEDMMYVFGYDSVGDIDKTTKELHKFITETVLPQTGADKVNICPISMGGSVAVSYLDMFPEDHSLIKKIVYIVPAINGSEIVGDLYTANLSTQDSKVLYGELLPAVMGEGYLADLIGIALRFLLPEKVLKDALVGLSEGLVEGALRTSTQLWATCPDEAYAAAREKWLTQPEFKTIANKVDRFMQARANFESNTAKLIAGGTQVYDIVCYGLELFPLSKNFKTVNSDGILQCTSTSMGATFANLGKTLGDDYKAVGTYCNNKTHNHLSPDGTVDPTTGLLPCTTWYFKNQSHMDLQYNNVAIELAVELMTDDNMIDVYSNPAYPQYNGERYTRTVDNRIRDYNRMDKSSLSAENIAEIESAIAQCQKVKAQTIIVEADWDNASAALETAFINAGIIKAEKKSILESGLDILMSVGNKALSKVFDK